MQAGTKAKANQAEDAETRKGAKAAALQTATKIVHVDQLRYQNKYAEYLQADNAEDRNDLDLTVQRLEGDPKIIRLPHEPMQPDMPGVSASADPGKYVKAIRKEFKANIKNTDADLAVALKKAGVTMVKGPPKADERLYEKADTCYAKRGGVQRVTDYERRSGKCPSFKEMISATNEIRLAGFETVRIKNRFSKKNKTAKESAGYRDLQLVVKVKGTELLLEIQLHLECMYKLKSEVAEGTDTNGETGHERYIQFRQLKEGAELL